MHDSNSPGGSKGPRLDILPRITAADLDRVANRFPRELRDRQIWVCADRTPKRKGDGRVVSSKAPLSKCGRNGSTAASSTDPRTWMTFAEACAFALSDDRVCCLGIMIEGENIVAVDYDHVIGAGGVVGSNVEEFIKRLPRTYTEISPGRDGVHQIYLGGVPTNWRKQVGDAFGPGTGLECYSTSRYLTVTGDTIGNTEHLLSSLDPNDPPGALLEHLQRREQSSEEKSNVGRSRHEVEHMLSQISNTGDGAVYDDWMVIGMACRTLLGSVEGLEVFTAWSSQSNKHVEAETARKFDSFDELDNPPGWGTLCELADASTGGNVTQAPPLHSDFGDYTEPPEMRESQLPPTTGSGGSPEEQPLFMDGASFRAFMGSADFAVDGLMPRRGMVQVFGDPGAGKSLVALSLAMAIACGEDEWHGRKVKLHGPVAVIVGEDGTGVAARFIAECAVREIDPATVPIVFSTKPTQLVDAEAVQLFGQGMVDALGATPVFVITDTFATNFGAGNEDSTEDMNLAMANAAALQRSFECLLLFVHHSGVSDKKRGRGNSAFLGAMDAEFSVSQVRNSTKLDPRPTPEEAFGEAQPEPFKRQGTLVTLKPGKTKNWAPVDPLLFEIAAVDIGTRDDGSTEDGGVVVPFYELDGDERANLIPAPLQAVVEEALNVVLSAEANGEKASRKDIKELEWAGVSKHARDDLIARMMDPEDLGFLTSEGRGRAQCLKVSDMGRKWFEEQCL